MYKYKRSAGALILILLISSIWVIIYGCATPPNPAISRSSILHPDEEDNIGGTFLESSDIRTIAQQMTAAILSLPEISSRRTSAIIAISPIKNSSRFIIDSNIFMKRLRIELNRVARDRVTFASQDNAQEVRSQIIRERRENQWAVAINKIAVDLNAKLVSNNYGKKILKVAVGEVKNTNISGLNATSFLALLRSKLSTNSSGRIVFVSDQISEKLKLDKERQNNGINYDVDMLLTGEFIGEGIHQILGEIKVKETIAVRQKEIDQFGKEDKFISSELEYVLINDPNANLWFNAHLVDLKDNITIESIISIKNVMHSGIANSDYILSGEISSLSKASEGNRRSDYIIVSFQLINPDTNIIIWEEAFESKRASSIGTVYR